MDKVIKGILLISFGGTVALLWCFVFGFVIALVLNQTQGNGMSVSELAIIVLNSLKQVFG